MYIGSPQSWPSNGPSGIQIIGNKVLNSVVAIQVNNIADVIIDGNVVFGKTNTDSVQTATGIRLNGGSLSGTIQNNEITSDLYGIISDAQTPIPDAPSNLLIKKNTIHESFEGIRVNRAIENIIIEKNTVNAIATQGQPQLITGIRVTTSPTGPATTNVQVIGNTVTSQGGIQINGASSSCAIIGSKIIDNTVTMTVTIGMTTPLAAITSIFAPNIVIQNNLVTTNINEALVDQQPIGIRLYQGCDGGLIKGNIVSSEFGGIRLNGVSGVRIEANTINLASISIDSSSPLGAPNVNIIGNTINAVNSWKPTQRSQSATGINLVGASTLTTDSIIVTGNTVTSELWGIRLNGMKNIVVTVSDNDVTSKSTAIYVDAVQNSQINDNTIQVNEGIAGLGGYYIGITLHGDYSTVSGNTIFGDFQAGVGIGLPATNTNPIASVHNLVTGNTITGNGSENPSYGLWFWYSAADNIATGNTISGVTQVYQDDSPGQTNIVLP
jgi:hypothetical protein